MSIRDSIRADLAAFADTLEAAGFRVYRPGGTWMFLGFAREVDGQWCSATVQASDFPALDPNGWSWNMNIVPSGTNGSGMHLDTVPNGMPLTVETATEVTVPRAYNRVVGTQPNGGWPTHWRSA